eukprot:CFRG2524T1
MNYLIPQNEPSESADVDSKAEEMSDVSKEESKVNESTPVDSTTETTDQNEPVEDTSTSFEPEATGNATADCQPSTKDTTNNSIVDTEQPDDGVATEEDATNQEGISSSAPEANENITETEATEMKTRASDEATDASSAGDVVTKVPETGIPSNGTETVSEDKTQKVEDSDHTAMVAAAALQGAAAGSSEMMNRNEDIQAGEVQTENHTETESTGSRIEKDINTENGIVSELEAVRAAAAEGATAGLVVSSHEVVKVEEERQQSHVSQRAMVLAGGRAAASLGDTADLAVSESFSIQLPVTVPGDIDSNAYKKCPHLINEARKSHTFQTLHEVQLTGVLPITKNLQKTLDHAHKANAKLQARMEKEAKQEQKQREANIVTLEKRLNKDLTFFQKKMNENEGQKTEGARSTEDVEMEARRLKWPHYSEYDRVISHQHLDTVRYLYRLRLLDYISIYENVHASEWSEIDNIEDSEWSELEKKQGLEGKKLDKEIHWGMSAKLTGKKKIGDQVLAKPDYDKFASEERIKLSDGHKTNVEELKAMQVERRKKLEKDQEQVVADFISKQKEVLKVCVVWS